MFQDERYISYINSLDTEAPAYLNDLEKWAVESGVPVIGRGMRGLLRVLLALSRPQQILEVGAAIGFSALFMSEYAPSGHHITTIENDTKRIPLARENFKSAGKEDKITLLEGDAREILPGLTGSYDFILMDAAKGQYIHFLPNVLRLLGAGGILVSDNVLRGGDILESRFAVRRRNRTIHARMREYLYALKHNDALETVILPLGDGAAVSVKKGDKGREGRYE